MKILLITTIFATLLLSASSCHRDPYYRCQCNTADSTFMHELGRNNQDAAYATCKTYEDSSTYCVMWVMK
jgi:hypothetical protein